MTFGGFLFDVVVLFVIYRAINFVYIKCKQVKYYQSETGSLREIIVELKNENQALVEALERNDKKVREIIEKRQSELKARRTCCGSFAETTKEFSFDFESFPYRQN